MQELITQSKQLPDNLEDLAKFALIGREKLNAVKAEIRAIDKVGLAKEVHEQKLQEAQEIAEAVLDAEVKIGELTSKIPKATPNNNPFHEIRNGAELVKPKSEQLSEIGIKQDTAERFERLAKHPEKVKQAKEEARAEGKIVTRQDVLNRIPTKLHSASYYVRKDKTDAINRHKEFEEKKANADVIDIQELQQDKEDKQVAINHTKTELMEIVNKFTNIITVLGETEITEMYKTQSDESMLTIRNRLYAAHKTAIGLLNLTEDIYE